MVRLGVADDDSQMAVKVAGLLSICALAITTVELPIFVILM
jgi:hypothetical protein